MTLTGTGLYSDNREVQYVGAGVDSRGRRAHRLQVSTEGRAGREGQGEASLLLPSPGLPKGRAPLTCQQAWRGAPPAVVETRN